MQCDQIDEMLTRGCVVLHPVRWHGLDAESSRPLTEDPSNRRDPGPCQERAAGSCIRREETFLPDDPPNPTEGQRSPRVSCG